MDYDVHGWKAKNSGNEVVYSPTGMVCQYESNLRQSSTPLCKANSRCHIETVFSEIDTNIDRCPTKSNPNFMRAYCQLNSKRVTGNSNTLNEHGPQSQLDFSRE